MTNIKIPKELIPKDGRFGSGPSLIPDRAMESFIKEAPTYLGTSHRRTKAHDRNKRLIAGVRDLFQLPDGWEVLFGNGGASYLWDSFTFRVIERRSAHQNYGEFSSKFVGVAKAAPHLDEPEVFFAEYGDCPEVKECDADVYALTQCETSTGVASPLVRPAGPADALVVVDATSSACGMEWSTEDVDIYYFSLQKGFASDGGTWVACCSPKALERIEKLAKERWCPASLDLSEIRKQSEVGYTYNTNNLTSVFLAVEQIEWVLSEGGLKWAADRCRKSSGMVYDWANEREWASPMVQNPEHRSPVVATIDIEQPADAVIETLTQNGIVDTQPYRKIDRNFLRFGLFPARDPEDVAKLLKCMDFVIEAMMAG